MECNKDEALRAKEIAEKKFLAKDIGGAKKFAAKAQNLYPGLEGISHMLKTLDVYIAAEEKVAKGEPNFYGILGVSPKADEETVRKHYRKLALLLHPDKNKSIGAEGAFKFISQAWSLLSDKNKRLEYDQRNIALFRHQHRVHTPNVGSSPPSQNGFYDFAKGAASKMKPPKSNKTNKVGNSHVGATSQGAEYKTFWTVCHRCKMQYEYLRMYLNHNLLCPNCREAFFAIEIEPPSSNGSKTSKHGNHSQHQHSANQQRVRKNTPNNGRNNSGSSPHVGSFGVGGADSFQWGPFSKSNGAASTVQAASMVHKVYEKVRRDRQEAEAAARKEEALRKKSRISKRPSNISSTGNGGAPKRRCVEDLSSRNKVKQTCKENGQASTLVFSGISRKKDLSQIDSRVLFREKGRKEISEVLKRYSTTVPNSTVGMNGNIKDGNLDCREEQFFSENAAKCDKDKLGVSLEARSRAPANEPSDCCPVREAKLHLTMDVQDPDFHDFDGDRLESCFGDNQVWAAYDDYDGMPRYYAMIHSVISLNPFKMRISWLNSKAACEPGLLSQVTSGFPKSCGGFRIGKQEINSTITCFSHKVRWTQGTHGTILVFPRKGDVWALYRNWSPKWNELTEDEVIKKYDMVEVLEDYNEELGVTIIPLVKVAGFKTLFHRHLNMREIRRVPKEEILRFSHQVPSFLLGGKEGSSSLKGCLELDPAATPSEFLEVVGDIMEAEGLEDGEGGVVEAGGLT